MFLLYSASFDTLNSKSKADLAISFFGSVGGTTLIKETIAIAQKTDAGFGTPKEIIDSWS